MRRVFIIHGWSGSPDEGWFPWLKSELGKEGLLIQIPAMPEPDTPIIKDWVEHIRRTVGQADEETFFIGHSIGCQAIIRYLETIDTKISGAIFVAGWFSLTLDDSGEPEIAEPWLKTPIDFEKVRANLPKSIALFSDNDPYVPAENKKLFAERLGSEIVTIKNRGHFSDDDGVNELPEVLDAFNRVSS